MGQAKQRGDFGTRKAEGKQRKAATKAAFMARQAEYQAHRENLEKQSRKMKAAREAAARALVPTDFSSGIAQRGVYEALMQGFRALEQQSQVKDNA